MLGRMTFQTCSIVRRIPLIVVLMAACSPTPDQVEDVAGDVGRPTPEFGRHQPDLFTDVGAQPNAWADYDNDGDLDLFVGFRGRENRLYRNDQGTFTDVAGSVGLATQAVPDAETRAAAWGDYDGDGDLDLYLGYTVASRTPVKDRLYRNDEGGARFVDVSQEVGLDIEGATRQPAFVDYDGDGDVDLFVALRDQPNRLHRNDGGLFVDVTAASGIGDPRRTVGAAWFDADEDGDLDVFVANQNGDEDGFFQNQGDGTFVDVAAEMGMHQPGRSDVQGSVGTAVADYDNDGDLDVFVASYGPDLIWENQRPEVGFQLRSVGTGLGGDHHSVSADWGDMDNDGWLDLYVGVFLSGVPEAPDYLYRNLGDRSFHTVTPDLMVERGTSHGVAWADFDQDGDLDLALANNDPTGGTHHVYRNLSSEDVSARSLQVVLLDDQGRWTRAGSEVRVFDAASGQLLGTRMIETGGGYSSQGARPVHFGLPQGVELVDVEVTVLLDGTRSVTREDGVDPAALVGRPLEIRR
jgi:hypothetical protein